MKKEVVVLVVMAVAFVAGGDISSAMAGKGVAGSYGGFSKSSRNNKLYFFQSNRYWRWNIRTDTLDGGYPKSVRAGWPGIPDQLDAAVYAGESHSGRDNKLYLFKGRHYWRWNIETDKMDSGYPKLIRAGWPGLPDTLDAAAYAGKSASGRDNKLYFFKGSQYWRWDIGRDKLEPGYPKSIRAGWPGIPNNVDMAIYAGNSSSSRNNRLYFFKGCNYWRWNIETDTLDKGYPAKIKKGWPGLYCGR